MNSHEFLSAYVVSITFGAMVSFGLFFMFWFLPKKLYRELLRPYRHLFWVIGIWLLNDGIRKLVNMLVWIGALPFWTLTFITWVSTMIGCVAIGLFLPVLRNVGLLNYMEDIRAESYEKFKAIFNSTPDAVITTNHLGEVIDWNPSAERVFGYSAEEMKEENILRIMPEAYRQKHLAGMKRFTDSGTTKIIGHTIALEGLRKNGAVFPIELSLSYFTVRDNKYLTAIIRDITRRRSLEKENAELKLHAYEQ